MKNLYQYINELTKDKWHYYFGIDNNLEILKPFVNDIGYREFIWKYFKKGGKAKIFELSDINLEELRLPNHICSVFFLGIILYNETEFLNCYKLESSDTGYDTFPFLWFLIALFHDNAYQMEDKDQLQDVTSISDLIKKFHIDHSLLDGGSVKCKELLNSRHNYFLFRKQKWNVVDHGILGGMLLFDRLIKIRQEKKRLNEDTLFWGEKLESQYETAANAISIHNIWLQPESICNQFNLKELLSFRPIRFKDFPLFYILGVVDTIEPLKTFQGDSISDIDILKSINIEFGKKYIQVMASDNSKVDFRKLIKKVIDLDGWLDVRIEIKLRLKQFKLTFR